MRTLGPLHIEDLDPHRFEDLVRQLLYDLRDWSALEATGRSGTDDGFDIRATERAISDIDQDQDENTTATPITFVDRVWLVQCKREISLGPSKMRSYLSDLPKDSINGLYGLMFVCSGNLSKTTRDTFYDICRGLKIQEAKLWGRAEIEDLLFQPKNDHLLFAYFGVSLQIRKASIKSQIKFRLSMKRKAKELITQHQLVLVRTSLDDEYPFGPVSSGKAASGISWKLMTAGKCLYDGLHVVVQRAVAYANDDRTHWDYAEGMNDARPYENPWETKEDKDAGIEESLYRQTAMGKWDKLGRANRFWLEKTAVISYESIIEIDPNGDEYCQYPHLYVSAPMLKSGPFRSYRPMNLYCVEDWAPPMMPFDNSRTEFFDRKTPEMTKYLHIRGQLRYLFVAENQETSCKTKSKIYSEVSHYKTSDIDNALARLVEEGVLVMDGCDVFHYSKNKSFLD